MLGVYPGNFTHAVKILNWNALKLMWKADSISIPWWKLWILGLCPGISKKAAFRGTYTSVRCPLHIAGIFAEERGYKFPGLLLNSDELRNHGFRVGFCLPCLGHLGYDARTALLLQVAMAALHS